MKTILYAYDLVENDNEYVKRMVEITSRLESVEVIASLAEFWNPSRTYDFIVINWPDYLFDWRVRLSDEDYYKAESQVNFYQSKGTKLINIRHDAYPHTDKSKNAIRLYDLFNVKSAYILHLGEFSVKEYCSVYGKIDNQQHLVIPHVLFKEFNFGLRNTKDLRLKYGYQPNDFIVFVPGNIRSYQEFKSAIALYRRMKIRHKKLLFQNMKEAHFAKKGFTIQYLVRLIKRFYHQIIKVDYLTGKKTSEELSELFAIADLVFISRTDNLNSGNITLAAQFNKPIVAIETGNVTEWIKKLNQNLILKSDLKNNSTIELSYNKSENLIDELANDEIILNELKKIVAS